MSNQLDIPEEELSQFGPYLQIFSKGKVIVQEGSIRDQKIFLLRQGKVQVLKTFGNQQHILGEINAVNFFGEMAVISQRPRTATIVADSDPVAVYAFDNPNLPLIMAHPKWGGMLLKRLADDLQERHNEYESAQIETERLRNAISQMAGSLLTLYSVASGEETQKKELLEAIPKLIAAHMHGMQIQLTIPDKDQLESYRRRGVISETLYRAALFTREKLKD